MKRPNIGRMQRHAARSVPDRIRFQLDELSETLNEDYKAKELWFEKKMMYKHGLHYRGITAISEGPQPDDKIGYTFMANLDRVKINGNIRKIAGFPWPPRVWVDEAAWIDYIVKDAELCQEMYQLGMYQLGSSREE